MIALCKCYIKPGEDINILCSADPSVKAKPEVYLCASWEFFSLKCSITRLNRKNTQFGPIFITTVAKNAYFLCANKLGLSIRNSEIF